jgi:hypothetical protein
MSVFSYGGRLYEVTGISPVDEDGYHYECWDLSPNSGGELGRISVPETGDAGVIIRLTAPVSAAVLLRWMFLVPELQRYGLDPDLGEE